ncbi:MAG: hypothetical protein RR494_07925 [Vagococcus sp.]|uniref:hypothetical protein n=1 Tax=Vagococcus sp. TaxID=1933889 RepID=UPI002FC61190
MGILVIVSFIFMLFCSFIFIKKAKKDRTDRSAIIYLLIGIITFFSIFLFANKQTADRLNSNYDYVGENRDKFYEIDNIVDNAELGSSIMNADDYNAFTVGGLTLEGIVHKYGEPSHVTGSEKDDKYMEVAYPTDETGYSIGLKFENKPGGFGDWVLTEKYVVETDGISFSEYEPK